MFSCFDSPLRLGLNPNDVSDRASSKRVSTHVLRLAHRPCDPCFVYRDLKTKEYSMRTSLPPGQTVTLHDMQMYYVDAGEGEPLLLLHGYTGASTDWTFCFDELASQYRLIIPDLRGHGRSTNPSDAYTQRQAARDVQALLDHLGIGSFQGIGASGGGNILLHLATQQPERVEAMVLLSAVSYYPQQARKIMRSYTLEQVSIALDMHHAIARSYLWIVPNGGHVPALNAPFVASLLPFLRGAWKRE